MILLEINETNHTLITLTTKNFLSVISSTNRQHLSDMESSFKRILIKRSMGYKSCGQRREL